MRRMGNIHCIVTRINSPNDEFLCLYNGANRAKKEVSNIFFGPSAFQTRLPRYIFVNIRFPMNEFLDCRKFVQKQFDQERTSYRLEKGSMSIGDIFGVMKTRKGHIPTQVKGWSLSKNFTTIYRKNSGKLWFFFV